ncbi:hypothetical protein NKH58_22585 [Mesorhizobium australicum]|uniref:hypothetical protein n=1 Tax=Mesorhizobium australicum TaxID=536018 RepID=UPI003335B0E8
MVTVAASVLTVGADDNSILTARWKHFQRYAIAFAAALMVGAFAGYGIRQLLPSPADVLAARLKELGMTSTEVAKAVAAAAGASDSPSVFLGTGIFYGQGAMEPGTPEAPLAPEVKDLCPSLGLLPWSSDVRAKIKGLSARVGAVEQIVTDAEASHYTGQQLTSLESLLARVLCGDR